MRAAPDGEPAASQVDELRKRHAALVQAAGLPAADLGAVLDAAFAELDGAIGMLTEALEASQPATADAGRPGVGNRQGGENGAERRLLRAVFHDTPVPLFLLALDGTVLRVNKAAGRLLGAKPGYATGRRFTAFVALPGRAAVASQLTAVTRSGEVRRVRTGLLGPDGTVPADLLVGLVKVSGDADQLIVAVPGGTQRAASRGVRRTAQANGSAVEAITARMDLVTAVTKLLLGNENFSESITLQRCARLLAGQLAAWVIVDMERRQRLRRQFVVGPDEPESAAISSAVAARNPAPGSVPTLVHESGKPVLIAHAEDAELLGPGPAATPLLMLLGATSVLSVPLAHGDDRYGVLTLARQSGEGHFDIADLALVTELGEQLALAIRVDRMFRRHAEIADALQASLLPRHLPEIDGVDLAAGYVRATEAAEIGADFYDVYRLPDGWGVSVGDVCGTGEEAAAVTAAARHAIRVIAHRDPDPAHVLAGANEILVDERSGSGFVTTAVAHLGWKDGSLGVTLGGAGHPAPAVVRSDGRVEMVGGGGLPLGLFDDAEPGVQEVTLRKGDVLFLYTNGVTQARGGNRKYFADRLADELARLAGQHPAEIVSAMRAVLLDFSNDRLIDDFAMLALRAGESP